MRRRPPGAPAARRRSPPSSAPAPLPCLLQGLITRKGPVENFADHIADSSINFYTVSEPAGWSGRLKRNGLVSLACGGVSGRVWRCFPVSPTLFHFPFVFCSCTPRRMRRHQHKRPGWVGVACPGGGAGERRQTPPTALHSPTPQSTPTHENPHFPCPLRYFVAATPPSPLVPCTSSSSPLGEFYVV